MITTSIYETRRHYYIIYKKRIDGFTEMFCVVEDEDVASQFCQDNEDYFYEMR